MRDKVKCHSNNRPSLFRSTHPAPTYLSLSHTGLCKQGGHFLVYLRGPRWNSPEITVLSQSSSLPTSLPVHPRVIQERYPSPDQTNHRDSLLTLTVSNRDLPIKPFPASFCSPGKICIMCEVMTSSGTQEKNVDGGEASSASSKNKGMGKRRCNVLAVRCAHLPNKHTFYAGLSVRYEPSCSEATGLGWGDTVPFTH